MLKISVLADNRATRDFKAEWGLSLFIEKDGKNILFDFGDSDLFLKNAEKMEIDPFAADHFVLSHGHWDHGNGLRFMPRIKLICHPDAFTKRSRGNLNIGLPFTLEEAKKKFDLVLTKSPIELEKGIYFLGEIERKFDFEDIATPFIKEDKTVDTMKDDSGLAIITDKGLAVISGCAHAGICNTVEYAKKITGVDKVYAVFGGFHLGGGDEQSSKTIGYFKNIKVEYISTGHCTQLPALMEFANAFNSVPFASGKVVEL